MQSKFLILLAFAAWAFICQRWYVCGIKDVCAMPQAAEKPAITPADTSSVNTSPSDTTAPQIESPSAISIPEDPVPASALQSTPPNLDRVQIESLKDRIIIHFPYNSTRREDNTAIDEYLSDLAANLLQTGRTVTITGHTDMIGDAAGNKKMGMQRAQHIGKILTGKGVPKNQILCRSMGESKPVATNDTPQGRYKNRRVEIRLSAQR